MPDNFSLLKIFKDLKNFFLGISKVQIDNWIFKAHYRTTSGIFLLFAVLITINQSWQPITCIPSIGKDYQKVIDQYCWVTSTYTVSHNDPDTPVAHVGVGPDDPDSAKIYSKYYQWVVFVFAFTAVIYAIPHILWKGYEKKLMSFLTADISDAGYILNDEISAKHKLLAEYIIRSRNIHTWYGIKYFLCQNLNLVITVASLFLLNVFLGGTFFIYGLQVIDLLFMDYEARDDPMIKLFPRVSKCMFSKYGPSGTIEKLDTICILPQNILNEKIFVFLWFYLLCLLILNICNIIYTLIEIMSMGFRRNKLKSTLGKYYGWIVGRRDKDISYGYYVFLTLLFKNIPKPALANLADQMEMLKALAESL